MLKRIVFVVGFGAAVTAPVTLARLPPHPAPPGLAVRVLVQRTGALDVRPTGRIVAAPSLRPGAPPAAGTADVVNESGQGLHLRVRATPPARAVDRLVVVRVSSFGQTLFRGRLSALRDWRPTPLELPPGAAAPLTVEVGIPRTAATGWEAESLDLALELDADWEAVR